MTQEATGLTARILLTEDPYKGVIIVGPLIKKQHINNVSQQKLGHQRRGWEMKNEPQRSKYKDIQSNYHAEK
jgi:hypothetical protein